MQKKRTPGQTSRLSRVFDHSRALSQTEVLNNESMRRMRLVEEYFARPHGQSDFVLTKVANNNENNYNDANGARQSLGAQVFAAPAQSNTSQANPNK